MKKNYISWVNLKHAVKTGGIKMMNGKLKMPKSVSSASPTPRPQRIPGRGSNGVGVGY